MAYPAISRHIRFRDNGRTCSSSSVSHEFCDEEALDAQFTKVRLPSLFGRWRLIWISRPSSINRCAHILTSSLFTGPLRPPHFYFFCWNMLPGKICSIFWKGPAITVEGTLPTPFLFLAHLTLLVCFQSCILLSYSPRPVYGSSLLCLARCATL
jgi:hypothetical protein